MAQFLEHKQKMGLLSLKTKLLLLRRKTKQCKKITQKECVCIKYIKIWNRKESYICLLGKWSFTVTHCSFNISARVLRNMKICWNRLLLWYRNNRKRESQLVLVNVSPTSIGRIIYENTDAIWNVLASKYLVCPNSENEWLKIASEFEKKWQFNHCLGE